MLEQVEWGEFRLWDTNFFEIGTGSLVDIKTAVKWKIPRISVQTTGNWILWYYDENLENARYFENFISINFFWIAYYHPYRASVEMKVHTLKLVNHNLTNREWVFIVAMLNKRFNWKYSYGSQLSSSKLKNENFSIALPTKNGEIDFVFMDKFIAELEAWYQAKLEAYLEVTGLKNYELTNDELRVLKDFEEGKIEVWDFLIWKLFHVNHYWKQRSQNDLQREWTPKYFFVMQNEDNNWVVEKVPEQRWNDFNLIPWNSISAFTHLNKVYYQEEPFYSKQWSNVYTLRSEFLDKQNAKFIISVINKRIWEIWYGKNTASRLATYKIQLPIKNNQLDFEFMRIFISAVEKLVIKDVVMYNKERLKATENVINQ